MSAHEDDGRAVSEDSNPDLQLADGPEDDVAMSFFDHLAELRRCLVRASLGVAVGFVVSFIFVGDLLRFLKKPLNEAWRVAELPGRPNLQVLEMAFGPMLVSGAGSPDRLKAVGVGSNTHHATYAAGFMVVDLLTNPYMNGETIRVDGGIRLPPR